MERYAKLQVNRLPVLIIIFTALTCVSIALYIYSRTYAKAERLGLVMGEAAFNQIMGRTVPALTGMVIAAFLIAALSLAFQTVTESRILTPSMIGFDSVFVGTQTLLVFLFGSVSRLFINPYINFGITASVMVVISMVMYSFILRRNRNNLVFLLMFGLILSGVVRSGSAYLQIIMDANEFNQVVAATSVNVNNMNTSIIYIAIPIMMCILLPMLIRHKTYNVMALGPSNAKNLGVNHQKEVTLNLMLISIGMSVTTALIGPLAFLGLLAVNIARELFRTYKHLPLFIGSSVLAALTLILGQALVEMMQGAVPVTVMIDLAGCSYMFFLIIKENRI